MLNKRVWLAVLVIVLALIGIAGLMRWRLAPSVRNRVVDALADRLDSQVALQTLRVNWTPRVGVSGEGLVVRHHGRTDVPPLLELSQFSADASLFGLLGRPMRLTTVQVSGLRINIPPHEGDDKGGDAQQPSGTPTPTPTPTEQPKSKADGQASNLTIGQLIAEDAQLTLLPKRADKDPKLFVIHHLRLDSLGLREQASFDATLTNPTPRGEIAATGTIGPWSRDDPGDTPLAGRYTFARADFATIRGISGTLDSTGQFGGTLDRIDVTGETRTPDFAIAKAGNPVPLQTKFHAVVDGTNGDTVLKRVDATLGQSPMVCTGAIIDVKGAHGHDIKVHVVMAAGRIEDLLRLAVRGDQPLMTGVVALEADLEIPPGEADVIDKMHLRGHFGLNQARFSSAAVQEKVETLSQRARGNTEPGASASDSIASNFRGTFTLKAGVLQLSNLDFNVPGAAVHLNGTYALRNETLDMKGTVTLEAKVSQTVTGYKSVILKLFDPLFRRKNAGAVIPITIAGTRKDPKIGLDIKRALSGGD